MTPLTLLALLVNLSLTPGVTAYARPDPTLTPGAINPAITQANIQDNICAPKGQWSTKLIRPPSSYTSTLKIAQMKARHLPGKPSAYEEDHLISLEIGGAPKDPKNLWPEPYAGTWGAKTKKDVLEVKLNRLVCHGTISLDEAQRSIASDWISAYTTYVLGHVLPQLAPDDPADRLIRDTKGGGQYTERLASSRIPLSDDHDFGGGQLRAARALADWWIRAALRVTIGRVIAMRPEKQMIRPHTDPVVAMMQHQQSIRDRAISDHPREPMGLNLMDFSASSERARNSSVAGAAIAFARPGPARVCLVHMRPEVFNRIGPLAETVAKTTTERTRPRRTTRHDAAALLAGVRDEHGES